MKIAHVISDLSRKGAGVTGVVESLSAAQAKQNVDVKVLGLDSQDWRKTDFNNWTGAPTVASKVYGTRKFGFAPDMVKHLNHLMPDLVHLHGIWMYPSLAVLRWHQATKRPFIVSPHGMLSDISLSYSSTKKKLIRYWFQDEVLHRATCVHVTSENELHEVRNFGLSQAVGLIPHGITQMDCPAATRNHGSKRVISLGRIHHKKGLDLLIAAWNKLPTDLRNWKLEIVGPEENGYGSELRKLISESGSTNISILGPLYGQAKIDFMSSADIFVLPTRNENFALTVAESLMLQVPVISTKAAPWSGLEKFECGRWIEPSIDAIASALVDMMRKPKMELNEMGFRGREWMLRDFSWKNIASRTVDLYRWTMNNKHISRDILI